MQVKTLAKSCQMTLRTSGFDHSGRTHQKIVSFAPFLQACICEGSTFPPVLGLGDRAEHIQEVDGSVVPAALDIC